MVSLIISMIHNKHFLSADDGKNELKKKIKKILSETRAPRERGISGIVFSIPKKI